MTRFVLLFHVSYVCLMLASLKCDANFNRFSSNVGFLPNEGQVTALDDSSAEAVLYILEGDGLNVQIRRAGFSYDAWQFDTEGRLAFHRIDVDFVGGSDSPDIEVSRSNGAEFHWFNRSVPVLGVKACEKVVFKDVYPGVDVEFVALGGTPQEANFFEYNFLVAEGVNADMIDLRYSGHLGMTVSEGAVQLETAFGTLVERIPKSWCSESGAPVVVDYSSVNDHLGFVSHSKCSEGRMIIDPVVSVEWATYLGFGEMAAERLQALDDGSIIVAGYTKALTGVATVGAHQVYLDGSSDMLDNPSTSVFCARFQADGTLMWATYYGGSGIDNLSDLKVNATHAVLTGSTSSNEHIAFGNAYISELPIEDLNAVNSFIALFSLSGILEWSTYLNGTEIGGFGTAISCVALTESEVYVAGGTDASDLAFNSIDGAEFNGSRDGFVARFSQSGDIQWLRYVGGPSGEEIQGLQVWNEQVVILGSTADLDLATENASIDQANYLFNEFLGFLSFQGELIELTYTGQGANEGNFPFSESYRATALLGNHLIACGRTGFLGNSFGNAFQAENPGMTSGFLTSINLLDRSVNWRTYFGTEDLDSVESIAITNSGEILAVGYSTGNEGLATPDAFQTNSEGATTAAFTALFDEYGNIVGSTYFGNGASLLFLSVASHDGMSYLGGSSPSGNFASADAHQVEVDGSSASNTLVLKVDLQLLVGDNRLGTTKVFPNPCTTVLFFDFDLFDDELFRPESVFVYDLQGQVLLSAPLSPDAIGSVDVSRLPAGSYVLQLAHPSGRRSNTRFMKL